jgi:hypothetical protein
MVLKGWRFKYIRIFHLKLQDAHAEFKTLPFPNVSYGGKITQLTDDYFKWNNND